VTPSTTRPRHAPLARISARVLLATACAAAVTAACRDKPSPSGSSIDPSPAPTAAPSSPASSVPDSVARRAVQAWSDALDGHDVDALPGLYAEQVRFYGRWLPRSAVVAAKRAALSAQSTFRQQVVGEITLTLHDDVVTAEFLKRSGVNGKPRDVRARLGLRKSDGECWTTCTTHADCPKDMCCRRDFNSPKTICMGRCWDLDVEAGSLP
jgi:hypothetical protein